jgi:hypothetical protein
MTQQEGANQEDIGGYRLMHCPCCGVRTELPHTHCGYKIQGCIACRTEPLHCMNCGEIISNDILREEHDATECPVKWMGAWPIKLAYRTQERQAPNAAQDTARPVT